MCVYVWMNMSIHGAEIAGFCEQLTWVLETTLTLCENSVCPHTKPPL